MARYVPTVRSKNRVSGVAMVLALVMATPSIGGMAADLPARNRLQPQPLEETVQGVTVSDPFRFLEDAQSPATRRFGDDEMAYTEALLGSQPGRAEIRTRLGQLLTVGQIRDVQVGGDTVFYRRREADQNQPPLYRRTGELGIERVVIDPNMMSEQGTVALDWYKPSPDGRYVAYGVSSNGSEISVLHVLDVETGKLQKESIFPARAAEIAWLPDGSGFYYGRPRGGAVQAGQELYNVRIYRHLLGQNPTGDGDPLVFGEGLGLKEAEIPSAHVSDDGRFLLFTVEKGTSQSDLYLKDLKNEKGPLLLTRGAGAIYRGFVYKGALYVTTNDGASRYHLFRVDATNPSRENWVEIVREQAGVLTDVDVAGGNRLVLNYLQDASSRIVTVDLQGRRKRDVALPGIGTVSALAVSDKRRDGFFVYQSYNQPQTGFRFDVHGRTTNPWLTPTLPEGLDPSTVTVKQVFYPSKDGTKIPMFIIAKKGVVLDGHNPTILYGYGGFRVSLTPAFSGSIYYWLEQGGIYAVANLRGGDEYGEAWHAAGMLGKKQTVFDDFAEAAKYLVKEKYTQKEQLGIYGGSNGGLLVGAAITQHPELYQAAVSAVPLLDMVRYHQFEIAKLWIPEYGSSEDPQQFKWLYAYSPYHHVQPGTVYPATLFMTADTDSRVAPLHALKMVARMRQDAGNKDDAKHPILLRYEHAAGHGQGKPFSKILDEQTDLFTFFTWQLKAKP